MGKKPKKGGPVVDDWENDIDEMQKEADGGDAPPQEKELGFYQKVFFSRNTYGQLKSDFKNLLLVH